MGILEFWFQWDVILTNLDVFWTVLWCLLDAFWMLCGCRLGAFWVPFGCLLDPWTSLGSIFANLWFLMISGTFLPRKVGPCLTKCWSFWRLFGGRFFDVFLVAQISNILQFGGPFRFQFGSLFGVPGNLENKLKMLKGVRFSHFGGPFCRHDF